jgi:1,2-phenylacetyl-CoA epoxidase PaaB subunit
MNAKELRAEDWDVQFAYPGRTAKHWRSVMALLDCTEAEAMRQATDHYVRDPVAVDMLVVPLEAAEEAHGC